MPKKHLIISIAAIFAAAVSGMTANCLVSSGTVPASCSIGDIDGDGSVNAKDATQVLIAAAKVGTGSDTGLTAEEYAAADVNKDTLINAKDATLILRYAASVGTGNTGTFEEFLTMADQPAAPVSYAEMLRSAHRVDAEYECSQLCITEAGVTGAPEGLAEAVTYDFDHDGTEELVTFSFEKNQKGGEDIAAALYTQRGGVPVLQDTLYMTDFLDLTESDRYLPNTIFFSDPMSMQIVSVEDGDTMHFGVLLNAEDADGLYKRAYPKGFGVFTVENGKFAKKMVGSSENANTSHEQCIEKGIVAAKILPPSLEGKLSVSDCYADEELFRACIEDQGLSQDLSEFIEYTKDVCARVNSYISGKGRFLLCADVDHFTDTLQYIRGGPYANVKDAYTALFQDFSMQLSVENDRYPGVLLRPAADVGFQQLVTICYYSEAAAKPGTDFCWMVNMIGCGKNLDRLLHRDGSGLEGHALFEDILRNPDDHPEVWKQSYFEYYDLNTKEMGYYVSDLDGDGGEEMLIVLYSWNHSPSYPEADHIIVVDTDGSLSSDSNYDFSCDGLMVDERGIACISRSGGVGSARYFDIRHMEYYTMYYRGLYDARLRNHTAGLTYLNTHACAEECRLEREDRENILLKMHPYDFGKLDNLEVTPRTAGLIPEEAYAGRSDWQNAYLDGIYYSEDYDHEGLYALMYLEEDIPAVVEMFDGYGTRLYMYNGSQTSLAGTRLSMAQSVEGYIPGGGMYMFRDDTAGGESLHAGAFRDGKFCELYSFGMNDEGPDLTLFYYIDKDRVTKEEFEREYNRYSGPIKYYSANQLIAMLMRDP